MPLICNIVCSRLWSHCEYYITPDKKITALLDSEYAVSQKLLLCTPQLKAAGQGVYSNAKAIVRSTAAFSWGVYSNMLNVNKL